MNLAAILVLHLFGLGLLTPSAHSGTQTAAPTSDSSARQSQSKDAQTQAQPTQSTENAAQASTGNGQATKPAPSAKPSRARSKRPKKTGTVNCLSATAAKSTEGNPSASAGAETSNASATTLPPCPTTKKVVRNGGSNEPSIQLVGGGTPGQTAEQRTIDQLTAATTENLKKLEGRQLNPTQQDMVSQIKQFMDQSKTAVAAGDLERGNNLAMKARLLSDELVKP